MAMPGPSIADEFKAWSAKAYAARRLGSLGTKADPTGSLIVSSYGLAQPVRTPRRFDKLADEGYNGNPIYAPVR